MKILTLSELGEDRFLNELQKFKLMNFCGDQRNKQWFDRIPQIYKKRFKEWFFLVNNDDIVAFSTIQEFYPRCFRLLTRTYYNPKYRRKNLLYDNTTTPAVYMFDSQLKYLQDFNYDTLFISMQDLKRRNALENFRKKLGNEWLLCADMIQTCNETEDKNCWQNVIYTGKNLNLSAITIDQWKKL